jgi:hypothetical protein
MPASEQITMWIKGMKLNSIMKEEIPPINNQNLEIEFLRAELAKNKAAKEWIEKYEINLIDVLTGHGIPIYTARNMLSELRALIQPEK